MFRTYQASSRPEISSKCPSAAAIVCLPLHESAPAQRRYEKVVFRPLGLAAICVDASNPITMRAVKLFEASAAILSVQGHIYFLAELFSTRQFFFIRNLYV